MDRHLVEKLNLTPKSDDELHAALNHFELKWQHKAKRLRTDDHRISRF